MNLGDHVGDAQAHVDANRALLARATGVHSVFLKQVHGSDVAVLDTAVSDGHQADACVTTLGQRACTIMVADCLPVLLCTDDGSVVAAAHAGWRGLAGSGGDGLSGMASRAGVLESVYASICASFKPPRQQIRGGDAIKVIAWLGPCIGPTAFEVGPEVKTALESAQPEAAQCFIPAGAGKYLANLSGLARLRLQALGITQIYGNDGSAPWCTAGNPSRFFSHRRDAGVPGNGFGTTGRMAAAIWRA
jgi:copper oxidase (laccase) domain-containing protein